MFVLLIRLPTRSTRTDTLFPYTTLFRSGRLRPRAAYAMGLIWWFSRIASHMPRFTNIVLGVPLSGRFVKWLGGLAEQRKLQIGRASWRERVCSVRVDSGGRRSNKNKKNM